MASASNSYLNVLLSDKYRRVAFALVAFAAILVTGAFVIAKYTTDDLLDKESEKVALDWANYLASNLEDINGIFAGAKPSKDSVEFLQNAEKFGNVFMYKFFDNQGALRMVSGEKIAFHGNAGSLQSEKKKLASKILKGQVHVVTKAVQKPNRPPVYSEAYVPVVENGTVKGVVEVYVDLTAKATLFRNAFMWIGLGAAALIALAFFLPATLWYRAQQRQKVDERIHFLAHHDPLTQLPNRARFIEALSEALATATATGGRVAVHYIDFDGFKLVNDRLGHEMGDKLLTVLAERLSVFNADQGHIARLGGDEFGIIQIVGDNENEPTELGEQVISLVSKPIEIAGHQLNVGCSIGTALFPEHGQNHDALLACADQAMYRAKAIGSGIHSLFDKNIDHELRRRADVEEDIRQALDEDGLELHFQPEYDAQNGTLLGFEALVRLSRSNGELLAAEEFIPIAEDLGLIEKIDQWVLAESCAFAANWPSNLRLSMNLSPKQFASGRLIQHVTNALKASGFPAERLVFEITERLVFDELKHVHAQLCELKEMGASIAIDDFGAASSSISYLWNFQLDHMKIDQWLIDRIAMNTSASDVTKALIDLTHSLGMKVTAEGVESMRQAEMLKSYGCDAVQGFWLGAPIPMQDVAAHIMTVGRNNQAVDKVHERLEVSTA
ncbi:MAG: EAL domain-containing protein [Hyphomicrobiaceae bacterium]